MQINLSDEAIAELVEAIDARIDFMIGELNYGNYSVEQIELLEDVREALTGERSS